MATIPTTQNGKALSQQIEANLSQTLFQHLSTIATNLKNNNSQTNSNIANHEHMVDSFMKQYEIFRVFQLNAIRSANGQYLLPFACELGLLPVVRKLVQLGCSVNMVPDKDAKLPLFIACETGNWLIVQFLITKQASLQTQDVFGNTPFIVAAAMGHVEVVRFLYPIEPNVNHVNRDGNSALWYAVERYHLSVVDFLLKQSKTSIHLKNKLGLNVFDLVNTTTYEHVEIRNMIIAKFPNMAQQKAPNPPLPPSIPTQAPEPSNPKQKNEATIGGKKQTVSSEDVITISSSEDESIASPVAGKKQATTDVASNAQDANRAIEIPRKDARREEKRGRSRDREQDQGGRRNSRFRSPSPNQLRVRYYRHPSSSPPRRRARGENYDNRRRENSRSRQNQTTTPAPAPLPPPPPPAIDRNKDINSREKDAKERYQYYQKQQQLEMTKVPSKQSVRAPPQPPSLSVPAPALGASHPPSLAIPMQTPQMQAPPPPPMHPPTPMTREEVSSEPKERSSVYAFKGYKPSYKNTNQVPSIAEVISEYEAEALQATSKIAACCPHPDSNDMLKDQAQVAMISATTTVATSNNTTATTEEDVSMMESTSENIFFDIFESVSYSQFTSVHA